MTRLFIKRLKICVLALLTCLALQSKSPVSSSGTMEAVETHRFLQQIESSADSRVRTIIANSRPAKKSFPTRTVSSFNQAATLITPLNSRLTRAGDRFLLAVSPELSGDAPRLRPGLVLEGSVERVDKAFFFRTNARIIARIYGIHFENEYFDLGPSPALSNPFSFSPLFEQPTKKKRLQGALMSASRLAVPLAIGSGGMSIAITCGAGALIGGALSEPGKRAEGILRGAWEGAGLTIFDPIVQRGKEVRLPEGTELRICLNAPALIPEPCLSRATAGTEIDSVFLNTKAQLLDQAMSSVETETELLCRIEGKLRAHDLASALDLCINGRERFPESLAIESKRRELMFLVTGQSND